MKIFFVNFIVYILVYPFLYLISILPFPLFYLFSDFIYIIVYQIVGYRKKIVTNNLQLVFPEKSLSEIISIRRKFYKHMCDMFLEMIKTMTVSKKELDKRFVVKNPEELTRLESLNKSVIVMYGHFASYEWSFVAQNYISYDCYGVYKKIKNKYFDKLIRRIRSKHDSILVSTKETVPTLKRLNDKGEKFMIAFIADQSPKSATKSVWLDFMDIKVPTFVGAESTAKKFDYAMSYLKVDKVKRGHYIAEFVSLADNPLEFPNFSITQKFNDLLEEQIRANPQNYLWTHKRWKHRAAQPSTFD